MPAYITVSVWGISPTASESDVIRYFEDRLPGCEPVVSPFARDLKNGTEVTTVTFTRKSKAACKDAVRMLQDENIVMRDAVGFCSTLGFHSSFLDLTLLTSTSNKPAFDVYFVHGLGGSAFSSFAAKPRDHKKCKMWARDFLPDTLDDRSLGSGRYLTFGYPTPFIDSDQITQSIQDTARELLRQIVEERGKDCTRPIFFVCHSLGGLVVCQVGSQNATKNHSLIIQAILLVLQDHDEGAKFREIQKALFFPENCLIKGITFFGTPFRGSSLANALAGISTIFRIPINKSHIMSLRIKDKDVARIVDEFEKRTSEVGISLLVFYELKPEKIGIFKHLVVERDSAKGRFGDQVQKIGLLSSHRGMAKFKSAEDQTYEKKVAPAIQSFVHAALWEFQSRGIESRHAAWLGELQQRAPRVLPLCLPDEPQTEVRKTQDIVKGGMDFDQHNIISDARVQSFTIDKITWLNDLVRELLLNFDTFQEDRKELIEIYPGTCDWILNKPEYKEFMASTRNSVLFIEGGPGFGKTALAKFLTLELAKKPDSTICKDFPLAIEGEARTWSQPPTRSPIVVEYFSRKEGRDNSPKAILMHIISQLYRADETLFFKAASEMFSKFTQQRGLEFYWSLFMRIRKLLERNLFCVIDGLDECIRQHRPEKQTTLDQKMVEFLTQLCDISREQSRANVGSITKVLLTTRFEQEVAAVATEKSLLLKILNSDITESFRQVVTKEVFKLARGRSIPTEEQEFITKEIIGTCGPVFQKGLTAIKILGETPSLDLANPDAVQQTLSNFNFDDYNDVYARVLERILPQELPLAAKIVRILFFTRAYLDMDELQHALAVDKENPTVADLERPPSKNTIANLIRSRLGSLISMNGPNGTLDLEHQSIYDFLRTLSHRRLQIFSCRDRQEGHLHLALICIRYLILWRHQTVSEDDIVAADGNETFAILKKSPLAMYASNNWYIHVREAGELIEPYQALVDKILGLTTLLDYSHENFLDYYYMIILQNQAKDDPNDDQEPNIPGPITFLCMHDLVHVLSKQLRPRAKPRRRFHRPFFKKSLSELDHPFNLDSQDNTGSTPLHYACRNECYEAVSLLLKAGAGGQVKNKAGYTPFACAVEEDNVPIAELLLGKGQAFDGGEASRNLSCIHLASHNGMASIVRALLKNKADPNSKAFDDWSPVHIAAQEGHIETLTLLLDAGGLPENPNSNGVTPLHSAAQKGHLDIIELLFQRWPGLNPAPKTTKGSMVPGATPLFYAARYGHLKTFLYLRSKQDQIVPVEDGDLPIHAAAEYGHMVIVCQFQDVTDINAQGKDERLPIHLAASQGHLEIFNYLKTKGAEIKPDVHGYLPIHLAARNGHLSVVKQFSGSGDINARTKAGALPIHLAARQGHLETFRWLRANGSEITPDNDGYLPIHMAADGGHTAIIKEFQGSPDIHSATTRGWLPIHLVAFEGYCEVAKVLKDLGADLDAKAKVVDANSATAAKYWSPLDIALDYEHESLARYLIEEGAAIDTVRQFGQSLLHAAARSGLKDLFLCLVQRGMDPSLTDDFGENPLHVAVCANKLEIVQEYIAMSKAKTVDIDAANVLKMTPFLFALENGHMEIAKILLSAGANVHARTLTSVTSLMFASREHDEFILRTLLKAGVDVNAKEETSGTTALHIAARSGNKLACSLLIEHHAIVDAQLDDGGTALMEAGIVCDVECVKLLLANGANPLLCDVYGLAFLDYMKNRQPLLELLKGQNPDRQPLSKQERDRIVKDRVRQYLKSMPLTVPTELGLARCHFERTMFKLAVSFFLLQDYARARTCYETVVFHSQGIERCFSFTCDACRQRKVSTSLWICKSCSIATNICVECYNMGNDDRKMPGCMREHEYFEVGGEDWAALKEGQINAEGKTQDDFIAELKREFGVENDPEPLTVALE